MAKKKLNGRTKLLADAMRKEFKEEVEEGADPLATQVQALGTEVRDFCKVQPPEDTIEPDLPAV